MNTWTFILGYWYHEADRFNLWKYPIRIVFDTHLHHSQDMLHLYFFPAPFPDRINEASINMTARSGSEQALHAAGGWSHKCGFYRYGYLLTWGAQLHFIILYTLRLYCNIFLPFVSVRYWVSFVGSKYDLYPTLSITTCNCMIHSRTL